MEIILWGLIVLLFIASLVGIVMPILPSVALVWAGVAVFHFFINSQALTWVTWGTMVFFTVVTLLADQISNVLVVQRFGGSKFSTWAAVVGAFVGLFVLPPFGIVLVPFAFVLLVELLQTRIFGRAFKAALGTVVAFVGSSLAKGLLQLLMIIVFFIDALG
ncbi:MAG: DUF456 family protein [Firmicutes bacterium]|nr:DUF456 family protein [Bacillota bacterium]